MRRGDSVSLGNNFKVRKGTPEPLGATVLGTHVNFAVSVPGAENVTLAIYRGASAEAAFTTEMGATERTGSIFCTDVQLPAETPEGGWQYEYTVKGERFVDPYARLVAGREQFGRHLSRKDERRVRGVIRTGRSGREEDRKPAVPLCDMILYKLHVRGFTKETSSVAAGTYAGLAGKAEYLRSLGINAVLLMPVMEYNECFCEGDWDEEVPNFVSSKFYRSSAPSRIPEEILEEAAKERKVNYWGYAGHYYFFAPKASYAQDPSQADTEFAAMVRRLHRAGIEVLMEVMIPAGTNISRVVDALRFWVREYRIDGFRIHGDMPDLRILIDDPYLSDTKFLCGGFPNQDANASATRLAEYHAGFLVDARKYLKGDEGMTRAFAGRFTRNAGGLGVINYVTDHDGFTLADLYMYDVKHNDANGERGRDGSDYNYSWNCGAEGPDKRRKIRELRLKMRKNALLSVLLSQGTPMLLAGDEFGNSQGGNNNAYNQDNATGWINWSEQRKGAEITAFVKAAIALRKEHPVLHNPIPLRGTDYLASGAPDVSIHGREAWRPDDGPYNRCLGVLLNGAFARKGRDERDDSFYILFNMYWEEQTYAIPILPGREGWKVVLATDSAVTCGEIGEDTVTIPARTIVVLQSTEAKADAKKRRVRGNGKDMTK